MPAAAIGTYSLAQWLLFFYIYCLIGWCFESTVVSVGQRKWVNRGFMRGPVLPIYGSGAMVILISTLPIRENFVLTYLCGALAATLLEYVTGVCMEALFQVRYWDYSQKKFNFQGHICLSSTIVWGFLSLLMVNVVHLPIERMVLKLPEPLTSGLAFVITALFAADFTSSFRTAIDLKELLMRSEKLQEELLALQLLAEQLEALVEREKEKFSQEREKFTLELQSVHEKQLINLEKLRSRVSADKIRLLGRNPSALSRKYRGTLERLREHHSLHD